MKVKPLKNYLLVKVENCEQSTKSGILLAGAREESNIAKIVETADCYDDNGDILKKDSRILMNHINNGTRTEIDGEEYLIISQKDVLAVLT